LTERIQKALAQAGIASRRQVEQWIREGRLSVNGAKATPGTRVGPQDRIKLDGRPVRLRPPLAARVVAYHRSPGQGSRGSGAGHPSSARPVPSSQTSQTAHGEPSGDLPARIPGLPGGRWVAISPLPPGDGGLELLTNDGNLSYALTRRFGELRTEFALRVLGDPRLEQLERLRSGAIGDGPPLKIESLELEGGEGANRWFKLTAQGAGGRDIRRLCDAAGLRLSRLMRVMLGPVIMERSLARGRTRTLDAEQTAALYTLAGLAMSEARPAEASRARVRARKSTDKSKGKSPGKSAGNKGNKKARRPATGSRSAGR
jgi:23S rRNA pseudouridine2605 synthase